MATFHRWTDRADQVVRCFLKGAPDVLAGRADRYLGGTEILPLDDTIRQRYIRANAELAEQGMRVLAIGVQDFPADAVEADDPMDLLDRIVLVALSASSTHPAPRPRRPSRSAATPASGSA